MRIEEFIDFTTVFFNDNTNNFDDNTILYNLDFEKQEIIECLQTI